MVFPTIALVISKILEKTNKNVSYIYIYFCITQLWIIGNLLRPLYFLLLLEILLKFTLWNVLFGFREYMMNPNRYSLPNTR